MALNDRKPLNEWSQAALDLKTEGVGLIEGDPPGWLLDQTDLVVVSPGVPTRAIPIRYADRRGAEVIGEIELASRFLRGRIVAITDEARKLATVDVAGVKREVNITCIIDDRAVDDCVGDWVLIHVGFAMSRIDERQAQETWQILTELGEAQQELAAMRASERS